MTGMKVLSLFTVALAVSLFGSSQTLAQEEEMASVKASALTVGLLSYGEEAIDASLCEGTMSQQWSEEGVSVLTLAGESLSWESSSEEIAQWSRQHGMEEVEVIVLAKVWTTEVDRFGNFSLLEATIEAKAMRGFSGELLAQKSISFIGPRRLGAEEGAREALTLVSRKMAHYLQEEVFQKASLLVSKRLLVTNLQNRWQADLLIDGLMGHKGVRGVTLEMLSPKMGAFNVHIERPFKDKLGFYIEHLVKINLKVLRETPAWIEATLY